MNDHRLPLANPDTCRGYSVATAPAPQFTAQVNDDARRGSPERMPDGDGTTVDVK